MDQKLIERFFKAECSPEEHKRIVAWYLSGEADQVMSERIEAYWSTAVRKEQEMQSGAHVLFSARMSASSDDWGRESLFEIISHRINESTPEGKIVSMSPKTFSGEKWIFRRYAAAIALLVVLSGWWYFHSPDDHANELSSQISYISKHAARGEQRTITLNDGTVVMLNADTRLWYNEAFDKDSVREVYLEGEAFFDVVTDRLHPFQIHTGSVTTRVLGTSFNVQAFSPNEEISVSVVSGKVKVSLEHAAHEQSVYLLPGEQAVYAKADTVISTKRFEYQEVLAWKHGTLYFKNAAFPDIVETLERWYGVEIEVQRQGIEDGFSGSYSRRSLKSVLEGMSFVLDFDYEIKGRKITIK